MKPYNEYECRGCGFDFTGPSPVCPECGSGEDVCLADDSDALYNFDHWEEP